MDTLVVKGQKRISGRSSNTKVCGNVEYAFTRDQIDAQMKTEFVSALQPAFGALAELELRPAQIPAAVVDLVTLRRWQYETTDNRVP